MVAVGVLIIGCGGGGSTNATPNTTTTASPTRTIDQAALDQANAKQLTEGPTSVIVIKGDSTLDTYFAGKVEPQGYSRTAFDQAVVAMNKFWFKSMNPDQYKKPYYVLVPKPKSPALSDPANYEPGKTPTPADKITKKVKKLVNWNYWLAAPWTSQKGAHEQVNAVMVDQGYPMDEVWWAIYVKNKGDVYDHFKPNMKLTLPQPYLR
jgi:hypothetical protein